MTCWGLGFASTPATSQREPLLGAMAAPIFRVKACTGAASTAPTLTNAQTLRRDLAVFAGRDLSRSKCLTNRIGETLLVLAGGC